MNKLLFILKVLAILSFICWGCSPRAFTGEISHVSGDTACLSENCFLLLKNAPKAYKGQIATFTPTVKRKKINCKLLK